MTETYRKVITTRVRQGTIETILHPKRNISKLKMAGLISSTLLLSIAIFSAMSGESVVLAQQQQSMSTMMMSSSSSIPQPNANGTLLKAAFSFSKGLHKSVFRLGWA